MPRAIGVLALLAGCHGIVSLDPAGSSGSEGTSAAGGPHPACASSDGVRLCGGNKQCQQLNPPECPGTGCTPALDIDSFAASHTGVCWADIKDAAPEQCIGCPDGQVCAQRYDDQLVCVSPALCEALWDLGATNICRYADKVHYDRRPLPAPAGCPDPRPSYDPGRWACGGDCQPCPRLYTACFGRSPDHPFGLCERADMQGRFNGQPCAFDNHNPLLPLCDQHAPCLVYAVPDADVPAARRYGVCDARCLDIAKKLPGGVHCLDDSGAQVDP